MARGAVGFVLFFCCCCAGCAALEDAVIRSLHMDLGYRDEMLPLFFDSYRRKLDSPPPSLLPAPANPGSADQG
jgi:hypothetical protein